MYNKEWFRHVVLEDKRKSFPLIPTNDPSAYPYREYVWYFLTTRISPFIKGFNKVCRWLWEEQDKYNPKYCDLYFRPTPNSDILIKVDNIHKQFL